MNKNLPEMKRRWPEDDGSAQSLKPYISKRKKQMNNVDRSKSTANGTTTDFESGSKIFTINPTVACHVGKDVICKLPRSKSKDFHEHTEAVTSLQWNASHYSHLLLTSSLDRKVKIWDCFSLKRCVRTLTCHEAGVKSALWTVDGENVLSGGFDKTVKLTDAQYSRTFQEFDHTAFITCLQLCPSDPQLFLAGTDDSAIYCWDMRVGEAVYEYKGKLGQILSLEFLPGRDEFLASCDFVCRNSDDRNIMVFDLRTTAVISNQIYHEKYTCPSLKVHPEGLVFVAQSNANYAAMFSTNPPFRLNKFKRFEGHQVEGYTINCDFSPDGSVFASGSSDGKLFFYNFVSTEIIKTLSAYDTACTNIQFHPVLGNMVASGSWNGQVTVWH